MKHFSKHLVAAAVLGLSGTIMLPLAVPAFTLSASQAIVVKEQTRTFAIENMYCAACPITVRKAMEGVAGVKSVKVNFEAKTATVVYDPSAVTVAAIAAASTNAGYPAKAIGS
ncbi:heavy metal-associated domain-containing protein [Aminobacter ciceronei]|uniref:Mercuric ion binding protein n=1 Tax=Aminobacter ciceronei TaxID=150723 RepID=A0ABR6C8P6_9HYPH|nr:heavy metal-associated domain-containing protein [Aminobacter ciceronei]MBA8907590.1 mercuric ion binding protein [Aminobacter ciceronei]MBA9021309.1 mercuric ion binding protein [Aminobacter ciceronei]